MNLLMIATTVPFAHAFNFRSLLFPHISFQYFRCICATGSRLDSIGTIAWDTFSWEYARARIDLGAIEVASEGINSELERSARYWLEVYATHSHSIVNRLCDCSALTFESVFLTLLSRSSVFISLSR